MYALVLNGNPRPERGGIDAYAEGFTRSLRDKGHEAERIDLRDLDIKYCTGCWSCWWATPGLCAFKDDMTGLYPKMVRADLIVWASPMVMGNVSALAKKATDRIIPLIHPYIELHKGECHHKQRYARSADIGLILEPGRSDGQEDLDIVRRQYERLSLNTQSSLRFFATTDRPVEEAANEALAG